ncbi:MAG: hypothetical protein A2901_04060 [Elusimicrobia bacterium RIFCSPLOWO2_01_FULL_54_10]|nr:MAG: hypothetical protein A2901_04060 [Elusimicrobia bacterium RIFCSPLOWO2_01_FULL_54_10]
MRLKLGLILAFLLAGQTCWAKDFEGIIKYKIAAKKDDMTFTYYIKGMKTVMEWESSGKRKSDPRMKTIADFKAKKAYTLMHEQKQYMVIDMDRKDIQEKVDKAQDERDFVKTGRKEKILGYACEEYISKYKDGETEMWLTDSLGKMSGFYWSDKEKGRSAWQKHLADKGFMPLRIVDRKTGGKETLRMEAIHAEAKSLSASLFEIPGDYKIMEMPKIPNMKELMKGFGQKSDKE